LIRSDARTIESEAPAELSGQRSVNASRAAADDDIDRAWPERTERTRNPGVERQIEGTERRLVSTAFVFGIRGQLSDCNDTEMDWGR
jgi:hypothetical protein